MSVHGKNLPTSLNLIAFFQDAAANNFRQLHLVDQISVWLRDDSPVHARKLYQCLNIYSDWIILFNFPSTQFISQKAAICSLWTVCPCFYLLHGGGGLGNVVKKVALLREVYVCMLQACVQIYLPAINSITLISVRLLYSYCLKITTSKVVVSFQSFNLLKLLIFITCDDVMRAN